MVRNAVKNGQSDTLNLRLYFIPNNVHAKISADSLAEGTSLP